MIMDDTSSIKDVILSREDININNGDDMQNFKDTILDLWNAQAWIAMIINDTSNIKDVILSLEDININNGDHKWNVE